MKRKREQATTLVLGGTGKAGRRVAPEPALAS